MKGKSWCFSLKKRVQIETARRVPWSEEKQCMDGQSQKSALENTIEGDAQ
jgi:hypothetical protein